VRQPRRETGPWSRRPARRSLRGTSIARQGPVLPAIRGPARTHRHRHPYRDGRATTARSSLTRTSATLKRAGVRACARRAAPGRPSQQRVLRQQDASHQEMRTRRPASGSWLNRHAQSGCFSCLVQVETNSWCSPGVAIAPRRSPGGFSSEASSCDCTLAGGASSAPGR
jgi:hypothetical protein